MQWRIHWHFEVLFLFLSLRYGADLGRFGDAVQETTSMLRNIQFRVEITNFGRPFKKLCLILRLFLRWRLAKLIYLTKNIQTSRFYKANEQQNFLKVKALLQSNIFGTNFRPLQTQLAKLNLDLGQIEWSMNWFEKQLQIASSFWSFRNAIWTRGIIWHKPCKSAVPTIEVSILYGVFYKDLQSNTKLCMSFG